ncbi:carboxypeptidase regulatory-like domain-containing protein [Solimonas marina]|uniref:Carboxypeptidase regulatory-like domain-containing protein n=1 Tax=Solimonas marina TaxID=2714601 RepID=A0A970B6H1_9GAMM|nr:carboxypeptidase regulatory-like domain-containing protein [Solimonas marina]NKF24472.1 carboxypeptidase regulatory-like domain-containing protein [Solimonas marina]
MIAALASLEMRPWIAAALGLATLAGCWLSLRASPPWSRRLLRAGLQLAAALLFWFTLYPPTSAWHADALTVLTAGDPQARPTSPLAQDVVALPEAKAPPRIARVPDLATARREHPQLRRIDVIGDGLTPRDQNAARGLRVQYAPPAGHGLIALQAPQRVRIGQAWTLSGRVAAPAVQVELHDPSGAVVDRVRVDSSGAFTLGGTANAGGRLRFSLLTLDAQQHRVDETAVPLIAEGGVALDMLVRAGAPDPELKYWRRWARDAGVTLATTIGLSEGLQIDDGDASLTPAALAKADMVVVDERAWPTLGADEKTALLDAVAHGLGLLLRVTGPVDPAVLDEWRALGFTLTAQDQLRSVQLPGGPATGNGAAFAAAALDIGGGTAIAQDRDGDPLVVAVDHGDGRIAITTLLDSYRLQLAGDGGRYGAWWARIVGAVARPRPQRVEPGWRDPVWVGERLALCDIGADARAIAPSGDATALLRDGDCAAYWPREAGWYRLDSDATSRDFYVRGADDATGLRHARDRAATVALSQAPSPAGDAAVGSRRPLPRWPWWLGWLAVTALLWWLERGALLGRRA